MPLLYARAGILWPRMRGPRELVRQALLKRARRWEQRLPPVMRAGLEQQDGQDARENSADLPASRGATSHNAASRGDASCRPAARRPASTARRSAASNAPTRTVATHPAHPPRGPRYPRRRPRRAGPFAPVWSGQLGHHFLKGLAANGNVRRTARTLGVHPSTFYRRRCADPGFAVRWKKAMKIHIDTVIDCLMTRAAYGWEEEFWYRNEKLGTRRVYDHRMAMQLVQFIDRRDREDRAEEAAARAEIARLAESYTGRGTMRGSMRVGAGAVGGAGGDFHDDDPDGETEINANHALMLDLMHRHRNRHPDEWDGDVHRESGFDFTDWESWVAAYEKRKRAG